MTDQHDAREGGDLTLDAMVEALKPFAAVAEHDIGSDESDLDYFQPAAGHNLAPRLTVGDLRRASAILARIGHPVDKRGDGAGILEAAVRDVLNHCGELRSGASTAVPDSLLARLAAAYAGRSTPPAPVGLVEAVRNVGSGEERCPDCGGPLDENDECPGWSERTADATLSDQTGGAVPVVEDAKAKFHARQIASLLELSAQATQGLWHQTHGAVVAGKDLILVRPRSDTGWVWKLDPTKELADGRFVSALVNWFRRNGARLAEPPGGGPVAAGKAERVGDWIQTFTGRQFWPMDPHADDVQIEDIAHALSMACRYAGHCQRFYSVAEHSVLLAEAVAPEHKLWALLHDASEAYLVDVPRPVKPCLAGYREAEDRVMEAVCQKFGLGVDMPAEVKRADGAILNDERAQNMRHSQHEWSIDPTPLGVTLQLWAPQEAERRFLDMFFALTGSAALTIGTDGHGRSTSAPDAGESWLPIGEAHKNLTSYLLKLKDPIPAPGRDHLRQWDGAIFVGRHPGLALDGYDIGWSFSAPIGHGGFPDDWFEGFRALPGSPS